MYTERFSKLERDAYYDAIIHLNQDGCVIVDKEKDTLSYNTNLITCHETIMGKPNDEELTRALIILNLISKYGYSANKIELEVSFTIGGHREEGARAVETDICIVNDKKEIEILCEVKRIHLLFVHKNTMFLVLLTCFVCTVHNVLYDAIEYCLLPYQ